MNPAEGIAMRPHSSVSGPDPSPLALVTGAAGIIGPAIVSALKSRGWRVVAADQSDASFQLHEKAFGVPVDADAVFTADLGSQRECVALVERIESAHGDLHAIIHGAALNQSRAFSSLTEEDALRHFSVNTFAPIFLAQAALPSLQANQGNVVLLSSVLVDEIREGVLLYACSKAAMERAAEAMAFELWDHGVRVNSLRIGRVPGYAFLRETVEKLPPDLARRMVRDVLAEYVADLEGRYGKQGVGRPEDIANAVVFLLSREARFINGETLTLDGGLRPGSRPSRVSNPSISLDQRIGKWMEQNSPARP
jgi:NAD(P)-dependent dehydrogenase (short-subunit alcohol dehydrogenase family)